MNTMKKQLAVLMSCILLAGMLCLGTAFAGAAGTAAAGNSVDIVILVDQSKSMNNVIWSNQKWTANGQQNDKEGYRMDAAQMLIAMCDMNGSRVAYLPFGGNIIDFSNNSVRTNELYDISDTSTRTSLMQLIEAHRALYDEKKTEAGGLEINTDYGNALVQAINLLQNRSDSYKKSNQAMIVLLTDGENSVSKDNKDIWQWDAGENRYISVPSADNNYTYTKAIADALCVDAANRAAQCGIKIYTVALYETGKREKADQYIRNLDNLAAITGVQGKELSSANATDLPDYFGDIFADQIGSAQMSLHPVQNGDYYEVGIPVLNESVREVNLMLPLAGIDKNSVELMDTNDKTVSSGLMESKNFRMYKIQNPRPTGIWKLRFKMADKNAAAGDISLNLLYNYTISLKTKIAENYGALSDVSAFSSSKVSQLTLDARFYDMQTNQPSRDSNLYTVSYSYPNQEAWWVINCAYSIKDASGNAVGSGALASNGTDTFSGSIDLSRFNLKSGSYTLTVTTDGAGLTRNNTLALTLRNETPALVSGKSALNAAYYVDYADGARLPGNNTPNISEKLSGLVTDNDKDPLTFSIVPGSVQNAELFDANSLQIIESNGEAYLTATVARDSSGAYKSGTFACQVTANDGDGGEVTLPVTIDVQSGVASAGKNLIISKTGFISGNKAQKSAPITVSVAFDPTQSYPFLSLEDYDATLTIPGAGGQTTVNLEYNDSSKNLEGKFNAPATETKWDVTLSVFYDGVQVHGETFEVQVGNHPPVATEDKALLNRTITFGSLPTFLSFLESPTPDSERTIDLAQLINDPDGETLSYQYPSDPSSTGSMDITENADRTILTLTPKTAGKLVLNVTGRDTEEENASCIVTLTLVDLFHKWLIRGLIALGALILLIILIIVLHQARKPKFPPNTRLGIREGSSLYDTSEYDIPPTKNPIKMSYCIESDLARRYGLTDELLENISLSPIRTVNGSIAVCIKKPVGSACGLLDNTPVGKKSMVWARGQALDLKAAPDSSDFLRVVLGDSGDASDSYAAGDASGFDFGSSSSDQDNAFSGFDAPNDSSNGSADAFDFGSSSAAPNPPDAQSDSFDFGNDRNQQGGNPPSDF